MEYSSPGRLAPSHISGVIRSLMGPDLREALADEITLLAGLLADIRPLDLSPARIRAVLAGGGLAALRAALDDDLLLKRATDYLLLQSLLANEQRVVHFSNAQADTIRIRDVAGGNISNTTINVWVWDRLGQRVPDWVAEQLDEIPRLEERAAEDAAARARLARLNLLFPAPLGDQERERIKDASRTLWAQVNWGDAADAYKQAMQQQCGFIKIIGMSKPVPLVNLFTTVYVLDKPSAWRRHTIKELQSRGLKSTAPAEADHRREGRALVVEHGRLFILGQPGSGKTTFLKHLAMQAVQGELNAIPIFVPLKQWSDSELEIIPYIERQFAACGFPNAKLFIETILTSGEAIVLFDGLDEVNYEDGKQRSTIQMIREFAQQYDRNSIVLTCRTAATEFHFEQFTYCEIADFTSAEIETFVGNWFQQDVVKRAKFLKAFAQPENERLSDLARRPLLLTMLCITFDETMTFPQRRAELYEEAIDALLKKWDSSRQIQRDIVYRKLSLGYKRQLLSEIAAETFERGEFFMSKAMLIERIVPFLRRLPPADQTEDIDGEAVLQAMEAHHGLLIERARGVYSFSHLTFQEYFTARYISNRQSEESLRAVIAQASNARWREVLMLVASQLEHDTVARMFHLWAQELHRLLLVNEPLTKVMTWLLDQGKDESAHNAVMRTTLLTAILMDGLIAENERLIKTLESSASSLLRFNPGRYHNVLPDHLRQQIARLAALRESLEIARKLFLTSEYTITATLDALPRNFGSEHPNLAVREEIGEFAELFNLVLQNIGMLERIAKAMPGAHRADVAHIRRGRWPLSLDIMGKLKTYLSSAILFLDCLDVAAVENRQGVVELIFTAPKQPEKRRARPRAD